MVIRCSLSQLLLTLMLFSFSMASKADIYHWQSTDYLVNSFVDIALNNEYSTSKSSVRKWTKAISYTITHRTADRQLHQHITELHLQHLASITGVKISPAKSAQHANLNIIFSSEKLLRQELAEDFSIRDQQHLTDLAMHSVCVAHFSTNSDNSIKKAIVIIPVDRARAHAKLLSCVVEELTQIMGLPNDSDDVYPSIFNDNSYDDYLSGLDFLLLKLLYHPSIKAGMNKQQTTSKLKQIIKQGEFQQLISQAEYQVHQQGLYHLLNQ